MSDCKEKFLSIEADVGGMKNNLVENKAISDNPGYCWKVDWREKNK